MTKILSKGGLAIHILIINPIFLQVKRFTKLVLSAFEV